jgi:hypothetical protein
MTLSTGDEETLSLLEKISSGQQQDDQESRAVVVSLSGVALDLIAQTFVTSSTP